MEPQYCYPQSVSYAYDESDHHPVASTQSQLRHFVYDQDSVTLPQHLDPKHLIKTSPSSITLQESFDYTLHHSMSTSPAPMSWRGSLHRSTKCNDHNASCEERGYGTPTAYSTTGEPDGLFGHREVPRSWGPYSFGALSATPITDFEPSMFMMDGRNGNPSARSLMSPATDSLKSQQEYPSLTVACNPLHDEDYNRSSPMLDNYPNHELMSYGHSTGFRMPSCEMSEDDNGQLSREMTAMETDDLEADEPYAKLIYRALMSTPSKSMVLQEIYQWFRENTTKGSSDSKGWMNSIRHNLSMNAAFKKTERKHSTDDTKKSTEWVLEDFAIKDGVQSTTRYRKGASTKKHTRSDAPNPVRQRSGQKVGIASRSSPARLRRGNDLLYRSNNHSFSRLDTSTGSTPMMRRFGHLDLEIERGQRSPLTPSLAEGPIVPRYGFTKRDVSTTEYGIRLEDEICGLEHVQGVYIDDGPVFAATVSGDIRQQEQADFAGYPIEASEGRF